MSTSALGAPGGTPIKRSLVISGVLHAAIVVAAVLWEARPAPARPPVYRVNIIGAPQGPKAIGVVDPRPATAPPTLAEAPSGIEQAPTPLPVPTASKAPPKPAPQATPTPARTAKAGQADATPKPASPTTAPRAGSDDGGRGADVATVRTDGIDFPSPGYLNNIVRQIELRFSPDRRDPRPLLAEMSFLIDREGRVSDIRVERSSGDRRFDTEARSSIEASGNLRAFGPLPPEWTDDVLRVYFTFTPQRGR